MTQILYRFSIFFVVSILLSACQPPWNSPYPRKDEGKNYYYLSFSERPKHLDPARSYASNEYTFIAQIYEPPLQYHFLKRPFQLIPLSAAAMPKKTFLDKAGNPLPNNAANSLIAFTEYDITIKPNMRYQPHPALAKTANGEYAYHNLTENDLADIYKLKDFASQGTRELKAADFVYQIKRLAHPKIHSPILPIMAEYFIGLGEYAKKLNEIYKQQKEQGKGDYLDLRQFDFDGVKVVDDYTYRIRIKGRYPQLLYWMAMPFFSPMPWEADRFYNQPGMKQRNISINWYPIGSGAYMLTENDPNREMIMEINPNFHGETYPTEGEEEDQKNGMLSDAGKPLPFIEKIIFKLEKESIPYWNKFLQGYYDVAGVNSESFDQVINIGSQGDISLTDVMIEKGISLSTSVQASTYYMGFNMLSDRIGGYSEKQKKLRRAIAIAVDYEENITIFLNGRGIAAHGPLPPGIVGFKEGETGINPYVYDWVDGNAQRKSIEEAKKLLADAGYPGGIDPNTGKPLILHFDATGNSPSAKAEFDWLRKQFRKINIQLSIRNTDYNRFQEKMRNGNAEIFRWGWNADYPDPENFLFLLYGPNGKVKFKGENAANYQNKQYDRLFEQMKNMQDGPERLAIIERMIAILREDSPWLWGLHPKQFSLYHNWFTNTKPHVIANNTLKYKRIDAQLRTQKRQEWNQPVLWPLFLLFVITVVSLVPAVRIMKNSQQKSALASET